MNRKWMRTGALVVACVTVGALLASTGAAAAAGTALLNVFVSNDAAHPVPVAGSVRVTNLPATQSVTGTVSVANLPTMAPVQNEQLYFGDIHTDGTGPSIDVSAYREIRMTVNAGGDCTAASPGHVELISHEGLVFDDFDIYYPQASPATRIYEIPGSTLSISMTGPARCFGAVAVYGRTN